MGGSVGVDILLHQAGQKSMLVPMYSDKKD